MRELEAHKMFLSIFTFIYQSNLRQGATAEYPATIFQDSTCAHIFKEGDMCWNKLTQMAGYSAVKP